MSLRKQSLLFFSLCFFCLFIILLIATSTVFLQGFSKVEQTTTSGTAQLAGDILDGNIASLAQLQQDWAEWDDAYEFVEDQNPSFAQTNLNNSTIARINLRLLVFLNTQNKVIFSTGIDLQTGKATSLPQGFASYLSPGSSLLTGSNNNLTGKVSGIIVLPSSEPPLLVASSPILTSDGQGPSRGTLIMARPLDEDTLASLAKLLHYSLKIERYDAPDLPVDFQKARASINLSGKSLVYFQSLDDQKNDGYMVLKDISGNPALLLRIEIPRQIYQEGQTSLFYLILLIMLAFIIFGGITLFLMERTLLRRISNLNKEVKGVAISGNLATRVAVRGKDEIGNLAQVINQMLTALEHSRANERESTTRFRLLIEKLSVGVTLHDADSTIQLANEAAADLLGLPLENLLSRDYQNVDLKTIHEDGTDFPEKMHPVHQAFLTRKPVRNVTIGVYRPRKEDWIWLLVNAEPTFNDTGELKNIICSFSDITERKKVEELKTEFISIVSHELRTPLTSIIGSLGLIIGGMAGEIPTTARTMLDIAYKNSDRLKRLINDILDIEKIESGKMTFHKKPFDLGSLLENTVNETQSFAEQYGVIFAYKNRGNSLIVLSDEDRLNQVIVNLLSNAAKFSPTGSTVEVSLECLDGKVARVAISDRGPGISDDFQNRIFEKFTQADSSATRQKGGTGLGLSISKRIMDKLKGQLSYTTIMGKGTIFYLELPLLETKSSQTALLDAGS